jgi:hypothetical protein
MRHKVESSHGQQTTDLGEDSAAQSQDSRELSDSELAHVAGGVQKLREAASPN